MHRGGRAAGHDQATVRALRERRDVALDLGSIAHIDWAQIYTECRCQHLDCAELTGPGRYGSFPKNRHALNIRHNLFEQLQPFSTHGIFKISNTCDVTARTRQAVDEARTDWIGDKCEDDWNGTASLQQRCDGRA